MTDSGPNKSDSDALVLEHQIGPISDSETAMKYSAFAANTRRPTFNSLDADRPRVDATQLEGVRDLHECFVAGPRMWRVGDDGHETFVDLNIRE